MVIPTHYTIFTPKGLVNDEAITLSTMVILKTAEKLGIAVDILPGTKIIQLSYNGQQKYFRHQISTETTDVGFYASDDKRVTNNLLRMNGIQVPIGFGLKHDDSQEYWKEVYEALPKPLVVKPSHGNKGSAITIGITDYETYEKAVQTAFAFSNRQSTGVLVEEFFEGNEYRITATREKVLAIMQRIPANVDGNGQHTIAELIAAKNEAQGRGSDDTFALTAIAIDEDLQSNLAVQGLTTESVPAAGTNIVLRKVSNLSRGGDGIDMTDRAHQTVNEVALKAVQSIPGLVFAGVDILTKDIETEQTDDLYRIVEVNTSPGFSMHEFPVVGQPRKLEYEFLYLAFPELRPKV